MRRTLAGLLCVLPLVACTPPPPDNSPPNTSSVRASGCDDQACLSETLRVRDCNSNGQRKITLVVTNTSTSQARYRLDYDPSEFTLTSGGNPGQIKIDNGEVQNYAFVSGMFGQALKITIAQLTLDGDSIAAPDKIVEMKLKPC